jgi:hypothetical protein
MGSWTDEVRDELESGRQARAAGNEGRARVCARRAAGAAAREHFAQRGEAAPHASSYDLLNRLATLPNTPTRAREAAGFLTLRVDEEFKLPAGVDLLDEARALCRALHPTLDL